MGRRTVSTAGLRGNVSTYRLNTEEIAEMVEGNLMPRPVGLLAAVIGVTFVGAKNIPLFVLPDVFEVRRRRVWDALAWLKANNPLYADIDIDADRLRELPECGVPEEILLNARYVEDESVLDKEHAGYVPVDMGDVLEGRAPAEEDGAEDEAEERQDVPAWTDLPPVAIDDEDDGDQEIIAAVMKDALGSEAFREKMRAFIAQNIRAHIAGTDGDTLPKLPKGVNIAYSRPEDPRLPNYEARGSHGVPRRSGGSTSRLQTVDVPQDAARSHRLQATSALDHGARGVGHGGGGMGPKAPL
ncbi:ATP-dependent DNA helicase [Mycena chlorophos]|uniref:ATP-dependent DNA helicase n=1 Tax=Mycena chlorophos TaxID=658473 RepID=A0A8H6TQK7_MYCCL|nr:ATP-dependent DNA helicase [Mycena chlorophos]